MMEKKLKIYLIGCLMLLTLPEVGFPRELSGNELDCVIEPFMTVELSSSVPGVLEEVRVKRGDPVRRHQIVAKLKSGVEKAGVRLAEAKAKTKTEIKSREVRYDLSKRNLVRTDELFKKKMVANNELDEAKTVAVVSELDVLAAKESQELAQVELERAREVLKLRTITSPINGVVVERYKSPGEFVEEKPILKLAQIDPLNVEVIAPLSLLGSIKKGMKAVIRPEKPIRGKYTAVVTIVDPVVDAASGTFGIRLKLPNPKRMVFAGMRCEIKFFQK